MRYITRDIEGNVIAYPHKPALEGLFWVDRYADEDDRVIIVDSCLKPSAQLTLDQPYCIEIDEIWPEQIMRNHESLMEEIKDQDVKSLKTSVKLLSVYSVLITSCLLWVSD